MSSHPPQALAKLESTLNVTSEDADAVSAMELKLESSAPAADNGDVDKTLNGETLSEEDAAQMVADDGGHLTRALDEVRRVLSGLREYECPVLRAVGWGDGVRRPHLLRRPCPRLRLFSNQVKGLAKPLRALGFRLASWGYLGVDFGTAMGISLDRQKPCSAANGAQRRLTTTAGP